MTGCSSSNVEKETLDIKLINLSIDSWLNLMPGSPGKFHLQGELTVKNSGEDKLNDLELKNILVYSEEEFVYNIVPYFSLKNKQEEKNILPGDQRNFVFGTESGLRADEILMKNNLINVKLDFVAEQGVYSFMEKEIPVERAY